MKIEDSTLESPVGSAKAKKRHVIPAGHIGLFSNEIDSKRLRRSRVCVLRRSIAKPFLTTAENVGYRKYFYDYQGGWDFDGYFRGFEPFLYLPVDSLINGHSNVVPLKEWVRVAAYLASLITRGPDLEEDLNQMAADGKIDRTRASVGYPINFQKTSAAVLRARWALEWSPEREFVLPDRGITGLAFGTWNSYVYHFPLRKNFAVLVGRGPYQKPLHFRDGEWWIQLEGGIRLNENTASVNSVAWLASRNECYGSGADLLLDARQRATSLPLEVQEIAQAYQGTVLLGLSKEEQMRDFLLIYRLLGGLGSPGDEEPTELFI